MKPEQIRRIAAAALDRAEDVARHWLPEGKRQGAEWVARNPRRDDQRAGSFSVNLTTGAWSDFATGDKGGDLAALIAYLDGAKQGEAARRLADFLGIAADPAKPKMGGAGVAGGGRRAEPGASAAVAERHNLPENAAGPILPIPAQAPPLPAHPRHGKPSATWIYRDAEGRALFHVCRFDPPNGRKQICPLTWWVDGWRWKATPAPRPLYNLDRIAAQPGAPVLVCEGEKAGDAAAQLFPDCPATTAPNGAQAPNKADWSPLKGRRVLIWPDNDQPGQDYAVAIARLARAAGAVSVDVLDLAALAINPTTGAAHDLPAGWDAADALADGWTAARLAELERAGKLWRPVNARQENHVPENATRENEDHFALRLDLTPPGIYFFGFFFNKHTRQREPRQPQWICSPLEIAARTRDVNGEHWGRLLEFTDADGTPHRWAMPMSMLAASGEELRGELLRQGLLISSNSEARRRLSDFVQESNPDRHARCVLKTGWHNGSGVFVFPTRTLGDEVEPVLFQSDVLDNPYRERGTLADWRREVAALCVGNSRLAFSVSCGFAAALLGLAGEDGGGFHFRGDSSTGKSTALRVAASVWGGADYLKRWRATDNALEALAALHSDTLLVLDEISQMDGRALGEAAYMLESGRGKSRADRNGNARQSKTWRLLFLSAGEISLTEHMQQAGKRAHAGQEIRMADIFADAGAGLGLFEVLHDRESGHSFSRDLCERAAHSYGTAGPAFIEKIIRNREYAERFARDVRASFVDDHMPHGAGGQAQRAAARFALVAAAGELASEWGITGWSHGEAEQAAGKCFAAWHDARGGVGNLEQLQILRQVRRFFELHGESRFTVWARAGDDRAPHTSNRAGFVKHERVKNNDHKQSDGADDQILQSTFYVLPEVFRTEISQGFDHREVERVLLHRQWLKTDKEQRATRKERLPGFNRPSRVYVLRFDDEARDIE